MVWVAVAVAVLNIFQALRWVTDKHTKLQLELVVQTAVTHLIVLVIMAATLSLINTLPLGAVVVAV